MKENYEKPEVEIVSFGTEDVVITSGNDGPGDWGEIDP